LRFMTTNINCFDSPGESPDPSQSAGNRITHPTNAFPAELEEGMRDKITK
jgi:hypothetical protein